MTFLARRKEKVRIVLIPWQTLEITLSFVLEILKILLRDEPLDQDVDLKLLAHKTESFSGSDLKRKFFSTVGVSIGPDPLVLDRSVRLCGT